MTTVVTIPPLLRTIIYYTLGIANVGYLAVIAGVAATGGNPLTNAWIVGTGAAVTGLSGLFFPVAGSNVQRPVSEEEYDARHDYELDEPVQLGERVERVQ
jgi:hypothetical protein